MRFLEPYLELEYRLTSFSHLPHVRVCNSGTAALHLALEALSLPQGSRIACPNFTMVSCARAIHLAGHVPVFIGCNESGNMCPDLLGRALEEEEAIHGILVAHLYGRRADVEGIQLLAQKYGLPVIEDLAEFQGGPIHEKTRFACYSFYRNKIIAGEEGGAVAARTLFDAEYIRELRSVGFTDQHDFIHRPRGHNYRLANCLAVLILKSLSEYESNLTARRILQKHYDTEIPTEWHRPERDQPWVYDLRVRGLTDEQRYKIVATLNRKGIRVRHPFQPMTHQPEFAQYRSYEPVDGPIWSRILSSECFYLPMDLRNELRLDQAVDLIRQCLK